jgi:AcrR family transcriptional regulator
MKSSRIDIGSIRREQIVDAAVAVIAEQGLQNLSLSEIEKRAGMSRGHLTYYFPAKEAILLAVFDRVLQLMCKQHPASNGAGPVPSVPASAEELLRMILEMILRTPPAHPEFNALQFTFLSQIGHREDFRQRLANLYEEWRAHMAEQLADDYAAGQVRRKVHLRTMASLIQAILHGLAVQIAADPKAFNRRRMMQLCLDMVSSYLRTAGRTASKRRKKKPRPTAVNGSPAAGPPRPNRP